MDNEAEDTITYHYRNKYIFRPDLGLSGNEFVVMPHPSKYSDFKEQYFLI